ncbi:Ppx/GppA phosphatase family protein [Persicitalea jodogahamensis]|uniref:Ppx/GppA phosphatase N-terminal domain-containing protein n=1 Tax=Persicitalea jodogahamensis TaxID=402147 RepID=A0A8J3GB93_9BACT|nr:phosphatase [Persicitalea jodogahamensis]GHB88645.1 hypothetical protein GCM10007390_51040 [Persicitalea jodogahamensis]
MKDRLGIIDLGTNTFHLLIVEKFEGEMSKIFHESRAARIGLGGINQRVITEDAIERALGVLRFYQEKLLEFEIAPEKVFAFGTSAVRNAGNSQEFCRIVREETGIVIRVIDGAQEAEYIYQGVKAAVALGDEPVLVMDIGGGSVEFIIGNQNQVFWKQSFEIGGQRLMEKFMRTDPLTEADRKRLYHYFDEQLIPLANAVHQYAPGTVVGSSGSFDTLVAMDFQYRTGTFPDRAQTSFELPMEEFYRSFELLLSRNHDERLAIPGMVPLRVDMIVVAACLIDYILRTHTIQQIKVSTYALKEGVLQSLMK